MTYLEKDTAELHRELWELRRRVAYLEARDSEQRWVAEALVQSETKFRELTEKSVVGVYVIQEGVFKYVNPKLAGIFGYEINELVGKLGPKALVFPEDWPMVDRNLRLRISGAVDAVGSQFRGIKKNGQIIHVEAYGSRTEHEGRPAVIGTLLDITESVQTKKHVDNEIKKFHALYDLALAMTAERTLEENLWLIVDKSRDLLSADKAFIALRDEEAEELYMHTLSGIVTDEFKKVRIPLGTGLGGKVAETGQWHIVQDYFQEVGPWFHDVVRAEGLMSGIAVPVQIAGRNLGVLYVFNRTKTPFSKSDLDTLSLLGNLAAVEITRKRVQQQLHENQESFKKLYEESKRRENLYVSLLNSSADAIVIYDMEGRAQHVSPSFTRIFGWTFEEVEGRRIPFVPEPEMERSMVIIRGLIRDGTPCSSFETKRFTKDGRILDISISASRCRDHEGNPAGLLVILRDITDRKRAEKALRESEERFRTLAEVAPFGMVVIAADESAEYINPKFTEIFGYTLNDVPDTDTWFRIAYPDEPRREYAAATWHGETEEIRSKQRTESIPREFTVCCKGGEDKTVSFRAVGLPDGRIIATFLDITAEAQAHQEIVRAKIEWERTFNAVSDLILITDARNRIVRANQALFERLGGSPEAIIGADCREATGDARTAASLCPDTRVILDGKEYSSEVTDEALGGVFDLRMSPLRDESDRVYGSVHVARDITALKSMERARRLAVHHLAHEIKTPLSIIKGSLKDLDTEALPPSARKAKVSRIRRSLERLADMQRIVQGIVEPRKCVPKHFSTADAIEKILQECRKKSRNRSVRLVPRVECRETDLIDPDVFEDVLTTLVKNAIENTPNGGEVLISLSEVPSGVLLQVQDCGVGITAEDRKFVFEAFHHTQDTERYATRNPFDFDAGGKGLELTRLKILSEQGCFDISFDSRRCTFIAGNQGLCPGDVSQCPHVQDAEGCKQAGGTCFSVLFRGHVC